MTHFNGGGAEICDSLWQERGGSKTVKKFEYFMDGPYLVNLLLQSKQRLGSLSERACAGTRSLCSCFGILELATFTDIDNEVTISSN